VRVMVVQMRLGDEVIHGVATGMTTVAGKPKCFVFWLAGVSAAVALAFDSTDECDRMFTELVQFRRSMKWEIDGAPGVIAVLDPGSLDKDHLKRWAHMVLRPSIAQWYSASLVGSV
jgi:hypothetical protein